MSSAISTDGADTKVRAEGADTEVRPYKRAKTRDKGASTQIHSEAARQGLVPWQFFLLAALGCATAVNVIVRGQGLTTIVLLTVLIASTALVGMAALRTLNPLVSDEEDRTQVIGGRTRAAMEREKVLTLRAIKELEFDRAMGKVSDADFDDMSGRLRARAARLIRQLDAGTGYREQIERDVATRLGNAAAPDRSAKASAERGGSAPADRSAKTSPARRSDEEAAAAERACTCGTLNDHDARFCKSCGAKL